LELTSRFALLSVPRYTVVSGKAQLKQELLSCHQSPYAMRASKQRQSSNSDIYVTPNQEPTSPGSRESGEVRVDGDLQTHAKEECETDYETLTRRETKAVNVLRALVLVLLFVTAFIASTGAYLYTANDENQKFEADYQANAERIIDSFYDAVVRRLGAINSMATTITSHALDTEQKFPWVTIPNFEIRGSDLRVQADAAVIHWMPLVTDETRVAWEEYALANRSHIDKAFEGDVKQREAQDNEFGLKNTSSSTGIRMLQQSQQETILDDGTGYHPRIWSNGANAPEGSGPYLPMWQRR
jgi:hypothetical protein